MKIRQVVESLLITHRCVLTKVCSKSKTSIGRL